MIVYFTLDFRGVLCVDKRIKLMCVPNKVKVIARYKTQFWILLLEIKMKFISLGPI